MFSDLKDRVAIITGGAGGIGKQTAIRMGELGAKICIADVSQPAIDLALTEFAELGIEAMGKKVDISKSEEVYVMEDECVEQYGKLDILVNCAGIYRDRLMEEMTDFEWEQTININLNGTYYCCRRAIDHMKKNGYGKIVSLTSQAGVVGSVMHVHYSAAKAGIIGLTRALAKEVAKYGIHVNCIAPGIIMTEMTKGYSEERREGFLRQIPLGRFGTPDEAAKVICFLSSDDSSYMTGQTINVTGGWLMNN